MKNPRIEKTEWVKLADSVAMGQKEIEVTLCKTFSECDISKPGLVLQQEAKRS